MSQTNNKRRSIFPLVVILLASRRGCVGQSIITEEDPRHDPPPDGAHVYSMRRDESSEITRNEPLLDQPPHVHGENQDATIHEVIHTDYIHEVAGDDDNDDEPIMTSTNAHPPQQHSVDSHLNRHTEQLDSISRHYEEETNVPTFTIEQLRTLLQTLEGEQQQKVTQNNRSWKSSDLVDDDDDEVVGSKIMEDDRTLLDVFGEAAKQFLTQKVIPETNPECKWDWRSLNCEPICECEFHLKVGDYHLGRSCRLRTQKPQGVCQSVDPAYLVEQTTLSQRIGWMMRRTWIGMRRRYGKGVQAGLEGLKEHSLVQLNELQQNVCSELWELMYNREQKRSCWSMTDVPSVSITQRLLCGPLHFQLCDDFIEDAHQPRTEYA